MNSPKNKTPVTLRETPDRAATPSPAAGANPSCLFYLYGILHRDTHAHQLLRQGHIPGLDPKEPLFPIESDSLVAAVSRVPASDFQEDALNSLLIDLSRVAPYALKHQEALQTLASAAPTLIPLAFGAVYRSPDNILQLLNSRASQFRGLLSRLKDKKEWNVKIYQDPSLLQKAVEAASSHVQRLDREIARSAPGRAYLLRKQRQRLLAAEADRLTAEVLDTLARRLAEHSAASSVEPVPEVQPDPTRLVYKASFLVENSSLKDFQEAAQLSNSQNSLGFKLDLDGPWPPYSFVGDKSALV